jgi:ABC-type transport system involved in cytochrome c biogenesis permease subunit
MDHSEVAQVQGVLTGALVFYVAAFAGYLGSPVSEDPNLEALPAWIARVGWGLHTLALIMRWSSAGIAHPPWTTLYESLAFFSWGIVGALVFAELRHRVRFAGQLGCALAACALFVARLLPMKASEPLSPELQSAWLFVHAAAGCAAYGLAFASACIAALFLLKDRVSVERLSAWVSGFCALALPLAAGAPFASPRGGVPLELGFSRVARDWNGELSVVPGLTVVVPGGGIWLAAVAVAFALHFVLGVTLSGREPVARERAHSFGPLGTKGEGGDRIALALRGLFVAAALGLFALLAYLAGANYLVPGLKLFANPLRVGGLSALLCLAVATAALFRSHSALERKLPAADRLDRLSYLALVGAFPLLTVALLSGAVWAQAAWGSYWSWEPKQIWTLVTWLFYATALHLRLTPSWSSRGLAVLSIVGFAVVLFAFLGVNLLMPGLHAFAAG